MEMEIDLTKPGEFVVGCNYWASHAGTRMWAEWDPEVVERDFRLLSDAGLQLLRVFPLWPDFQPIHLLRGGGGRPVEFRHGEAPLPDDPLRQAGLSHQAMEQFATFLDLAEKHRLKLLIGLLTGWMSGRLHLPPALEDLNPLTDPVAIQWEVRFVREFVGHFKAHPAIIGWDLGNECNCMGSATREQAYVWAATIANAIRAADPTRPVVSGMHGLSPTGAWRITDQAELTDLLCTHPYPIFTPHCDQDPVNTIRTILHSTAESRYYADIGGKPCLCQEIGTLGPVIASEKIAADFIRSCLFSLWANDCHGLVWWCANEQTELAHAPYDWHAVERELGLLRIDGSPKPVLNTITDFRRFLDQLPFRVLPQRAREAVCILTEDQDHWGVAYRTFILAKQAVRSRVRTLRSRSWRSRSTCSLPQRSRDDPAPPLARTLEKVEAGATLHLARHRATQQLRADNRSGAADARAPARYGRDHAFRPAGLPKIPAAGLQGAFRTNARRGPRHEPDGNPAFSVASWQGKGLFPWRADGDAPDAHSGQLPRAGRASLLAGSPPYRRGCAVGRAVRKQHPLVAVTEHPFSATERLVIALNQSPAAVREELSLAPGWRVGAIHYGQVSADGACALPANDAAVFTVTR